MIQLASTLPSGDGYVAAAYIVFFALILIYVAIMAVRLSRVERKLHDMQRTSADGPDGVDAGAGGREQDGEQDGEHEREREAV